MQKKLRILQVVNVRWFNATAWYGLRLSRLLADAGHDVRVLGLADTLCFRKAQEMGLSPVPLDINTLNPVRLFRSLGALAALLREFQPDIVNCHRGEGFVLFALLKKIGFPFSLVRTRGDQRLPKKSGINKFLHNKVADSIITTNSAMVRAFLRVFNTPPDHIHKILGGVDTRRFAFSAPGRAAFRQRFGIADDEKVIGLLGRFDPVKGHRDLIRAAALLKEHNNAQFSSVRLLLAGTDAGISASAMQTLAAEAGLPETILTGHCDDVAACISAMDLGVVASVGSEAIARAALEIISCGVPLIGTSVGVMPDLLPPWALVPPEQPAQLARLMGNILSDAEQRQNLIEANQQTLASVTDEAFLDQTLMVYERALKRKKTKAGRAGLGTHSGMR